MNVANVLDGNSAAAEGIRQINPDVVIVHPLMSSAPFIEKIVSFIAEGQLISELVNVESWSSVINACMGASASGGRVFTVSGSYGIAGMHETLLVAASLRLPIVMCVIGGSLLPSFHFQGDHSDMMSVRDSGWIQLFSEDPQEVYDNIIQAFKIAEHPDVRTPIMVAMDGWITSHSMENILIEKDKEIDGFVGKFMPGYSLMETVEPITIGAVMGPEYQFEHCVRQHGGIENAKRVSKEVGKAFGERFDRYYGCFEAYKLDDAEHAIVLMGSAAGVAKDVVDQLRGVGKKVGLLKLRLFRPFPYTELKDKLRGLKSIAVLDRSMKPGIQGGPLFNEIRCALYDCNQDYKPRIFPYVYGLGGRDMEFSDLEFIFKEIREKSEKVECSIETKYVRFEETTGV